jgi:hypothetical protein
VLLAYPLNIIKITYLPISLSHRILSCQSVSLIQKHEVFHLKMGRKLHRPTVLFLEKPLASRGCAKTTKHILLRKNCSLYPGLFWQRRAFIKFQVDSICLVLALFLPSYPFHCSLRCIFCIPYSHRVPRIC